MTPEPGARRPGAGASVALWLPDGSERIFYDEDSAAEALVAAPEAE